MKPKTLLFFLLLPLLFSCCKKEEKNTYYYLEPEYTVPLPVGTVLKYTNGKGDTLELKVFRNEIIDEASHHSDGDCPPCTIYQYQSIDYKATLDSNLKISYMALSYWSDLFYTKNELNYSSIDFKEDAINSYSINKIVEERSFLLIEKEDTLIHSFSYGVLQFFYHGNNWNLLPL